MKPLSRFLNNLSLHRKIQAIVLFTALLLTAVSLFGIFAVQRANESLLYNAVADSLGYSARELGDALDTAENLSYLVLSDRALQGSLALVKSADDAYQYRGEYQKIYERLSAYHLQFQNDGFVSNISIYNDRYATHAVAAADLPGQVVTALRQTARKGGGIPIWVTEFSDSYGLFLVRDIRRADDFSFETLGILVVQVDTQALIPYAFHFLSGSQTEALLSDGSYTLYASSGLDAGDIALLQNVTDSRYQIRSLSGGPFFIVQKELPPYGWTLTALLSFQPIQRTLLHSRLSYCAAIAAALLISLLIADRFARSMTSHFQKLIDKMHFFAQHHTIPDSSDYSARSDEIAVLHQQFDQMAQQTNALIEQNYVSELLRREAQLKALQMQINPHFLYNTLESLNWRAKAIGAVQISQMAEALGNVLRVSLSRSQEDFTLGKELELVGSYMTIQQFRFEDRLQYDADVDASLLPARLPRLTLQPLVENAIRYALEENPDDCRIEIRAECPADTLFIYVRNTGSSFEENFMEHFQAHTLETHGFGVGLQNINDRLRLTFGEAYGLSFYNEEEYAVVQISVPFQRLERGETLC